MNLIQDSRDILNLVIAFCILWLTIFFAWFVYYMAMLMKQIFMITKEMHERVNRLDEVIKALKDKIEHSASYLLLIGEGVKKLVEMGKEYWGDKGKKRK